MALMLIIFSAFFIITTINNNYLYIVDTVSTLEWLAESQVFLEDGLVYDEAVIPDDYTDETPIIGVIVSGDGTIVTQKYIGKGKNDGVDQKLIDNILAQSPKKQNFRSYVYSIKKLNGDNKLIVIQDTAIKSNATLRVFSTVLLVVLGIGALCLLTFFLSRFITDPAKRALEREKQFVSDASHELKTPISAISINAQALEMESDNINVKNILSETKRMNSLIEKLLTLSKYEETPIKDKEICSMSDILNEISLTYESIAFEKEIGYQYEIEDGITVRGDEDELKQLAVILIDNAIKNTEPLGLVTINLSKQNNHCVFEVKNTGKGIAEKDLPHIFERFYTLSTSRSDNSFGLGLPIAKSIAERHKGTITVNSVINEETDFKVVFRLI